LNDNAVISSTMAMVYEGCRT